MKCPNAVAFVPASECTSTNFVNNEMRKTRNVQACLSIALQLYNVLGTQNDRKTDNKASETKKKETQQP